MSYEIVKELEEIFGGKLEQAKGDVGCAWNLHGVPVYYEVEKTEEDAKAYFKDSVKYGRNEGRICYICEDDYKKYDGHVRDLIESYKNGELDKEEFRDELDGHNDYVGVDHGYIRVYAANRQEEVSNKLFRFYMHGDDCITARDAMIKKGKLIEENGNYFLLTDDKTFEEMLYEIYKEDWMDTHVSETVQRETMKRYFGYCEHERVEIDFDTYLHDFGFTNGEMYASLDEFVNNELNDESMKEYYLQKLYDKQEYHLEKYEVVMNTVNMGMRKVEERNISIYDEITVKEAYLKLLQDEFECVHGVTLDRNELENLYENVVLKSDETNLINENDFHDCEDAFFSKEKDVSLEH